MRSNIPAKQSQKRQVEIESLKSASHLTLHTLDDPQKPLSLPSHHACRYTRVRRLLKMIGWPAIRYAALSAAAPDQVDHETAVRATHEDGSEERDAELQPMLGERMSGSLDSVSCC